MAISLRIIDEALSRAVLQTTPASLDLNFHSFIEYLLTFILFIGAGSLLPITVFTMHDLYAGSAQIKGINLLFFGIYALEIAAGFFIYFKTKAK